MLATVDDGQGVAGVSGDEMVYGRIESFQCLVGCLPAKNQCVGIEEEAGNGRFKGQCFSLTHHPIPQRSIDLHALLPGFVRIAAHNSAHQDSYQEAIDQTEKTWLQ